MYEHNKDDDDVFIINIANLHLQRSNLRLDGAIFALEDVIEGAPLSLDVLRVEPSGGELESLALENPLTFAKQLHVLLPRLHLPFYRLDESDEIHRLRGRRRFHLR